MSTLDIIALIFGPIAGTILAYVTVRMTAKRAKQENADAIRKDKEDHDAQEIIDKRATAEIDEKTAARIALLRVNEIDRLNEELEKIRKRMDVLESRDRAFMNILNDAARQWPADRTGPIFHQVDLAAINGDMPATWVLGHA